MLYQKNLFQKKLFYNKSISKLNIISITVASLLLGLFIVIATLNSYTQYKNDINSLEVEYIKLQKNL